MHHLEVPDPLARPGIQADEAFAKETRTGPIAPICIIRRRLHAYIDIAELFVGRHGSPGASVSRVAVGFVEPGIGAKLAALGYGMKDPEAFAGSDVVSADVPLHELRRGGQ